MGRLPYTALGFNHAGRIDIALNPDQPEGVANFSAICKKNRIPYFAFRAWVAHKATGSAHSSGTGQHPADRCFCENHENVLRLLLIDNYDSFNLRNLAHLAASNIAGDMPRVVRNDEWVFDERGFDAIVISPGPGHPAIPRDFGVSAEVIRRATVPVLGVCLGHQGIALEFGGTVERVEPAHGEVCRIEHDGDTLFRDVPPQFDAVRYHSARCCRKPLPPVLRKIAWSSDGMVMAVHHVSRPLWGVQFHPESILSEHGATILGNFLKDAA